VAADHVSVDVTVACSLGHEGVAARATPAQIARVVRTEAIVRSDSVEDDYGLLPNTMCFPRPNIPTLSLIVDKLASCDALVFAPIGQIRSLVPVERLVNLTSRSWVHTVLLHSIIREGSRGLCRRLQEEFLRRLKSSALR
jgi:hypothetical protein